MKTRCMRIACWIPKATNTHSLYIMYYNTYVSLYVNCLFVFIPFWFCAKLLCRFSSKETVFHCDRKLCDGISQNLIVAQRHDIFCKAP